MSPLDGRVGRTVLPDQAAARRIGMEVQVGSPVTVALVRPAAMSVYLVCSTPVFTSRGSAQDVKDQGYPGLGKLNELPAARPRSAVVGSVLHWIQSPSAACRRGARNSTWYRIVLGLESTVKQLKPYIAPWNGQIVLLLRMVQYDLQPTRGLIGGEAAGDRPFLLLVLPILTVPPVLVVASTDGLLSG